MSSSGDIIIIINNVIYGRLYGQQSLTNKASVRVVWANLLIKKIKTPFILWLVQGAENASNWSWVLVHLWIIYDGFCAFSPFNPPNIIF